MEINMEYQNTSSVKKFMHTAGSLSLIIAPLLLIIGWALNYDSFASFFGATFSNPYLTSGKSVPGQEFLATITGPDNGFRFFLLPHYFIYTAMPILIAVALFLAKILFKKAPWHALVGATLTTIGAVYFIGVLGAYLSLPALASVPIDQTNLLLALNAVTAMKGVLFISIILSVLVFVGMIVLGFGFYKNRIMPRWSALFIIIGNILILAAAGTENFMVIGSLLMLIGLLPLSMKMLHADQSEI